MRGDLTLRILRALQEMTVEGIELCESIVEAGYGASNSKIRRIQEKKREQRLEQSKSPDLQRARIRNFQKLVSKLRAEGLVTVKQNDGKRFFDITAKGKSKLQELESQRTRLEKSYISRPSDRPIIVSFDVPEAQRSGRDWLRSALKVLGMKKVHQSVWIGMVKVPEDFLSDLKEMHLLEYIEIFEVGKTGTLRSIV